MLPVTIAATAAKILVTASTSTAIEKASEIIIPSHVSAAAGFALKMGVKIGAGLLAAKVGTYVAKNVDDIVAQLKSQEADVPTPEDV